MTTNDTPLRIGFVADKLNISQGGSNFSLDLIARTLSERGHNVTVVTINFAYENKLPPDLPYKVTEAPTESESQIGEARDVYKRLISFDEQFDIYHIFNPALHPIAGAYRRRHDTPVVGRLNTFDIFCTNLSMMDGSCHRNCTVGQKFSHSQRDRRSNIAKIPKYTFDTYGLPRLLNQMDRLFALSPQVSRIYQDIGVREARLSQIPNFYDPSFGTQTEETVSFSHDKSLLYVGAIKPHKGVDILVKTAPSLPDDTGLEIVGTGPQMASLKRRVSELGVADRVTFHGWVAHEKLSGYYREADIFVHPGRWPEPFNRTILEAMQCHCPLVVSDVGAPPWVVDDCGLVFDRGDTDHLSRQLRKLLTDETALAKLEANCQDRLETFAPERSVSLMEAQYLEFVN
jgi:glycosyltransferase involved in cell wall biosynthesis